MKGNHPPPAASPEEIARRIAELHPPEDERDLLPDQADDPPVETASRTRSNAILHDTTKKYGGRVHRMDE